MILKVVNLGELGKNKDAVTTDLPVGVQVFIECGPSIHEFLFIRFVCVLLYYLFDNTQKFLKDAFKIK